MKKYDVLYSCVSHTGYCRKMNQDNFICGGIYRKEDAPPPRFPIAGILTPETTGLLGVFDGMGGEERGEVAALLAAKEAAKVVLTDEPEEALSAFCQEANSRICRYAEENGIASMGTTAAILGFSREGITLCNIGDSRIFRFADLELKQISTDHVGFAAYGKKPPLSQNLGIPPSELVIAPYIARGQYHDGDVYLICSDGLTDMVPEAEIGRTLTETEFDSSAGRLLELALKNGGRDNATILLCRIERRNYLKKIFGGPALRRREEYKGGY